MRHGLVVLGLGRRGRGDSSTLSWNYAAAPHPGAPRLPSPTVGRGEVSKLDFPTPAYVEKPSRDIWSCRAKATLIDASSALPVGMRARHSICRCIKSGYPRAKPWDGGAGGAAAPCRSPRRRTALVSQGQSCRPPRRRTEAGLESHSCRPPRADAHRVARHPLPPAAQANIVTQRWP